MSMPINERIESIRYWLGEFESENCGYKEFARNMAEDMPIVLAELTRKDEEIKALNELVMAHDNYLLVADDVAEMRLECVVTNPIPPGLKEKFDESYERRAAARARLAEVRGGMPAVELPDTKPTAWSRNFDRRKKTAKVTFREIMLVTGIQSSRLSELTSGFPYTPTDDEVQRINDFFRPLEDSQ